MEHIEMPWRQKREVVAIYWGAIMVYLGQTWVPYRL